MSIPDPQPPIASPPEAASPDAPRLQRRTRADASRANGRKSRGPITPEGKAISSQNSRTHSLTSGMVCLTNEQQPIFDLLLNGLLEDFKPTNTAQTELVNELASIRWRQRRFLQIETALLDTAMDDMESELQQSGAPFDEPTRLARAFQRLADSGNGLELLRRYASTLTRQWDRTLANLLELQRLQNPNPTGDHTAAKPLSPLPSTPPENLHNEPGKSAPVVPITVFQPPPAPPQSPKTSPTL
jgi:hypothetical protein